MLNSTRLFRQLFFVALITANTSWAEEATMTLQSTVTGNQEQPRVMYVVPWQGPAQRGIDYAPAAALAEDLFRPIDRREFQRQLSIQQRNIAARAQASAATTRLFE